MGCLTLDEERKLKLQKIKDLIAEAMPPLLPGWVEDPQTHAPIGKRTYNGPPSGPTAKAQGQQIRLSDCFEIVMPITLKGDL